MGREREGAVLSFLVTYMLEKSVHTFPDCGDGTLRWESRTEPYLNLLGLC